VLDAIKSLFGPMIDSFTDTWNKIKDVSTNIWNSIWTGIKGVINKILGGIESFVNGAVDGINRLITGLNGVITKAGELIGIDVKIPTLGKVSLPRLAKGTNFVPFDTAAFIHKGEAVIPADNNPSNPRASNPVDGAITNTFNIANMIVRSDNDIKLIARELYNMQKTDYRASGVAGA